MKSIENRLNKNLILKNQSMMKNQILWELKGIRLQNQ
jgi:hypothetical protein